MKGRALVPGRADEKDIARLMDEQAGALLGVCRAILGDWALAQDVVQETFVKAWRMGGAPRENERAWLIRVAVNACRDELRGRWFRHTDRRVTPEDLPLAAPEADDGGVMDAVKSLPETEREVIVLFYWQDMSAEAIADSLGLSRSQVYRRLDRARRRLKLDMEGGSDSDD